MSKHFSWISTVHMHFSTRRPRAIYIISIGFSCSPNLNMQSSSPFFPWATRKDPISQCYYIAIKLWVVSEVTPATSHLKSSWAIVQLLQLWVAHSKLPAPVTTLSSFVVTLHLYFVSRVYIPFRRLFCQLNADYHADLSTAITHTRQWLAT